MTRDLAPSTPELGAAASRALRPAIERGLGFDLAAAIGARRVRLLVIHTVDGRPLPREWAIPILDGEVVVACGQLEPPFVGVAALLVDAATLPRAQLDATDRRRVAEALVDALLAEVRATPRGR
jgi:hypothetical protein